MKKVTAFVGTPHKGNTYNATVQFLDNLNALGGVETEVVRLSDYNLGVCRGCRVCIDKGEEFCQLKDDRDVLIGKIMASDGVVFATPNYSFQVSGLMKVFLDHLGFCFHRPRFFGKTYTSIVTEGIYGGAKIVDYLHLIGTGLGFNALKGSSLLMILPITESQQRKIDQVLAEQAKQFHASLEQPPYRAPGWVYLYFFHMGRTKMHLELDETSIDYRYYRDQGWFESDFFYPVELGPLKKGAGKLFDTLTTRQVEDQDCGAGRASG